MDRKKVSYVQLSIATLCDRIRQKVVKKGFSKDEVVMDLLYLQGYVEGIIEGEYL